MSSQAASEPTLQTNSNICPECDSFVPIKFAGPTSKISGQFYLHCFNRARHFSGKDFWKVFDPFPAGFPLPAHLQSLIARTPSPPLSSAPAVASLRAKCAQDQCKHVRVNKKCSRRMCRQHCLTNGGCELHHNQFNGLTATLQRSVVNRTIAEASTSTLTERIYPPIASPGTIRMQEQILAEIQARPAEASYLVPPVPRLPVDAFLEENQAWNSRAPSPPLPHAPLPKSKEPAGPSAVLKPAFNVVGKRPRITTQMNPTWMEDYSAGPPRGSSSIQGVKKDLTAVHRFYLVFFNDGNNPATVQLVQECPDWPNWKLSSLSQLPSFGDELSAVQLYSAGLDLWVDISLNSVHPISTNCGLLIRRKGICGFDEESHISRFFAKTAPRRFRQGISEERAALRRLEKGKKIVMSTTEESEGEVEFVDGPPVSKKRRHAIHIDVVKEEVLVRPHSVHSQPITIDATPNPSPPPLGFSMPLASPLSARSDSVPPFSPFPSPPPLHKTGWPIGCYAVDIIEGFKRIDELTAGKRVSKTELVEHLEDVFACRIPYNTYRDQRAKWKLAPQDLRNRVLEGGYTSSGLWGYLASRVPLK